MMNFQITFREFTNSAVRKHETRNGTVRGVKVISLLNYNLRGRQR